VTPQVRSRAWREPAVRFWWASALVIAAIVVYLSATQIYTWNLERRLIEEGVPVMATVLVANGVPDRGKSQPPESNVELRYTHDGQEYEVKGTLAGREEWIQIGSDVELRLDPNDPRVWTARLTPTPLVRQLVGAAVTVPVIVILLIAAWLAHRRTLRTYENGQLTPSEVVALRTSPIAPLSRAVVCTPTDPEDKRLFTIYIPQSLIRLQAGDDVNLLIDAKGRVLATMKYD
jgi:hypothetical protein